MSVPASFPRPRLPRNFAADCSSVNGASNHQRQSLSPLGECYLDEEEESFYVFKCRMCLPVTRSLALLLLVEPFDKMVHLDGKCMGSLLYLLYLPFGLLVFCIAELGFVFWFDILCQPIVVDRELIGIYGRGKQFSLPPRKDLLSGEREEDMEMEAGKRHKKPTSTCLCLYNACLETAEAPEDDNEEGSSHPISMGHHPMEPLPGFNQAFLEVGTA